VETEGRLRIDEEEKRTSEKTQICPDYLPCHSRLSLLHREIGVQGNHWSGARKYSAFCSLSYPLPDILNSYVFSSLVEMNREFLSTWADVEKNQKTLDSVVWYRLYNLPQTH